MKQILFFTAWTILAGACSSSKKTSAKEEPFPQQFAKNIQADGDAADWADIPLLYDKDSKTYYAIANDEQAIHFILKVSDQAQQTKVVRSGMDVWIDLSGKKTKRTAVKYPLPSEMDMSSMRNNSGGERPDMKEVLKGLLAEKKEMELEGFKDGLNGRQPLQATTTGIKVATGFATNGTLIYEMSVPFTAFAKSMSFDDPVSVGIVMKAAERPAQGMGGMGGRMGGGVGGGMGGRGMGGGRPGGMGGTADTQNLFKENSFWYKFSLASK